LRGCSTPRVPQHAPARYRVVFPFPSTASAFAVEISPRVLLLNALLALSCSTDAQNAPRMDASVAPRESGADSRAPALEGGAAVTPAPEGAPYGHLAQWHLFSDAVRQVPSPRVVPYEVISPLFADYAAKRRFIYVPEGAKIGYSPTEKWSFPVGTILVKTFSYLADAR